MRRFLVAFSLAALGAGAARALTTSYLPVLLERIDDAPVLIGAVMTVNAIAGFLVPLATGLWSDRRTASGLGRRLPFMAGGTVLGAGGLVAVALGSATSYLFLGLAAAVLYTGLNALTTAHRALVAEDFADERRPAAVSAQEVAGVIGAALAVAVGGALIESAPGAAFALVATLLVLTALPTLLVTRRRGLGASARQRPRRDARASIAAAVREPGTRDVLLAQTLWVLSYAALPAFFVLYAREELGLSLGAAGALPLMFGAFAAAGMAVAGRIGRERVHGVLVAAAGLLGSGLLAAGVTSTLPVAATALALAALGAGLLTALGFPYFARFVPDGEAGAYSGVFFAARGVAAAIALPAAGVAAQATGTYRSVLWFGAGALLAVVPLLVAERRRVGTAPQRARPQTVAAIIPVFASDRAAAVARRALRHVDEVVVVDDGAPPAISRSLVPLADEARVRVLTLERNGGKGTAVAAGVDLLLSGAAPPDAIVVLDSDGQHDPDRIPAFVEAAATADVAIGWRRERRAMPALRRVGNRLASLVLFAATRRWVPDTQNGMRLFRSDLLRLVPLPAGGYDAESRHLRALLATRPKVAAVEIPTIYDGEPSHFRPLADTARVARALFGAPGAAMRIVAAIAGALAVAAVLPVLQPLDNEMYLAINGIGDGPEWLYQALDPHTRNYILLVLATVAGAALTFRAPSHVLRAAVAVVLAGYFAGAALEVVKLFIERARPEEVLGDQVLLSHGRSWAHIASFPSGHLIVTAAMAAAAGAAVPWLRRPLLGYVVAVAFTRVLFGAHFPVDVVVGAAVGHQFGLVAAGLLRVPTPVATTQSGSHLRVAAGCADACASGR